MTIRSGLITLLALLALPWTPVSASDPVPPGAGPPCPRQPVRGGQCWTTEDVIDARIDHHAQSALLSMFTRGGAQAADASAILCAVKTGALEGVYLPDQQVPALRARDAGSGWWNIIPAGRTGECYRQPPARAPLIAFSKQIQDNTDLVVNAIGSAWRACAIPPTAPRCYNATISKPPSESPPSSTPPGGGGEAPPETAILITLMRDGAVYAGVARVFIANPGAQYVATGRGVVRIEVEPGTYNIVAQDYGIAGCATGAPRRVSVAAGRTSAAALDVPLCTGP